MRLSQKVVGKKSAADLGDPMFTYGGGLPRKVKPSRSIPASIREEEVKIEVVVEPKQDAGEAPTVVPKKREFLWNGDLNEVPEDWCGEVPHEDWCGEASHEVKCSVLKTSDSSDAERCSRSWKDGETLACRRMMQVLTESERADRQCALVSRNIRKRAGFLVDLADQFMEPLEKQPWWLALLDWTAVTKWDDACISEVEVNEEQNATMFSDNVSEAGMVLANLLSQELLELDAKACLVLEVSPEGWPVVQSVIFSNQQVSDMGMLTCKEDIVKIVQTLLLVCDAHLDQLMDAADCEGCSSCEVAAPPIQVPPPEKEEPEIGSFLKGWYEAAGMPVSEEGGWRKPTGFKGWGRCPGQDNLKTKEEMQSDRWFTEQHVLQPMRVFVRAYIRKHKVRPRAADGFTAAGGQALGLFMCGFDVVGFELEPSHEKNFMTKDEQEWIPDVGWVRHTMEFDCGDFFAADLSGFQVVTASPPCSPYTSLPELSGGRAPSQVPTMIQDTRDKLAKLGIPTAIENVAGAAREMEGNLLGLCGTMFGLHTFRHRIYELSFETPLAGGHRDMPFRDGVQAGDLCCNHDRCCMGARSLMPRVKRIRHLDGSVTLEKVPPCCSGCMFGIYGSLKSWGGSLDDWRQCLGLPHLNARQLALCIPPHYARYVGGLLAMEMCVQDGIEWDQIEEELLLMSNHRSEVKLRASQEVDAVSPENITDDSAPLTQAWQTDQKFMSWVLGLEKVPDRSMRQMREWFHWNDTRGNAVFQEGDAAAHDSAEVAEESMVATLVDQPMSDWAADWRPSRELFASLYWEEHSFGGFTHDVCRSGGQDMLKPYLGSAVRGNLTRWFEFQGARLWVQPRPDKALEVVEQVEQVWEGVGRQMAASLMVTASVAQELMLQERVGWSLHYQYSHGTPLCGNGLGAAELGKLQVWWLEGTPPSMPVPGVLPLTEALELEEADKLASQPKSPEEAAARELLKRTPIHISVTALKRLGFSEQVISWFEHGVKLGLHHEFHNRYEKSYPMRGDQEKVAAIKECNRMLELLVLEEVKEDSMEQATIVSPWVIILKGDKTRVCCDVLANQMMRPPVFALPCFRDCLQYLRPNSYVAVLDARDFFYCVPVAESDRKFLAVRHPEDGRLLRYARLPMGLATSPFVACTFSEEVASKLRMQGHQVLVYCDDWAVFGETKEKCQAALDALQEMLKELQVSVAPHKLKPPAQRQTWLGIEIDTRTSQACFRVVASRVIKMEEEMEQFKNDYGGKQVCDPRRLASIIGRCGFLSQVVPDGIIHMRRLYDQMKYASVDWVSGEVLHCWGTEPVPLSKELWRDLDWWLRNLRFRNCTPLWLDGDGRFIIHMGTDASDWGGGGELDINGDSEEMRFEWGEYERQQDINVREMATVVIMCQRWGERLRGARIRLRTDNQVSFHVIRKGSAQGKLMMELMRRLSRLQCWYGFIVEPEHIPGCVHFQSDDLSRFGMVLPPLAPRLRICREQLKMMGAMWGGFDVVKGAEFRKASRGGRQVSDVLPTGGRLWVHPRFDQVAGALKWVQAAGGADLSADTRALIVIPLKKGAAWLPLLRHMRPMLTIPRGMHALEMWTSQGWRRVNTSCEVGVFVYPPAAGMEVLPLGGSSLAVTKTSKVYVLMTCQQWILEGHVGDLYELMEGLEAEEGLTYGKYLTPPHFKSGRYKNRFKMVESAAVPSGIAGSRGFPLDARTLFLATPFVKVTASTGGVDFDQQAFKEAWMVTWEQADLQSSLYTRVILEHGQQEFSVLSVTEGEEFSEPLTLDASCVSAAVEVGTNAVLNESQMIIALTEYVQAVDSLALLYFSPAPMQGSVKISRILLQGVLTCPKHVVGLGEKVEEAGAALLQKHAACRQRVIDKAAATSSEEDSEEEALVIRPRIISGLQSAAKELTAVRLDSKLGSNQQRGSPPVGLVIDEPPAVLEAARDGKVTLRRKDVMAAAVFSTEHMLNISKCFDQCCGVNSEREIVCLWCGKAAHRSCCLLRKTDAQTGTVICGACTADMVMDPTASAEQRQLGVLDAYRVLYFKLTSDGASTAGAKRTLLNKVQLYEREFGRHKTLDSQWGLEMFLSWMCVSLGQAPSMGSMVFAAAKMEDGVDREWVRGPGFKAFVKRLTKLYGRKPETAMELTVELVHSVLAIIDGELTGDRYRDKVIVLLLFLAACRIGETAGYLRGIRAPNVLLGPECVIMVKEDTKTKSHESTTFVINQTSSGLKLADAIRALLQEMRVPCVPTQITLRGKLVMMDKPDYYTADLWFTHWQAAEEVLEFAALSVMDRLRLMLTDPTLTQLHAQAEDVWTAAGKRSATARDVEEQFVTVWGGTWAQVEQLKLTAATTWGLRLETAAGALVRGTRSLKGRGLRQWAYSPFSTGQAGKVAAQLFRAAAAKSYVLSSSLNASQANARAAKEKWVAQGGRRGFTTEVLARLAKYRAEHPEEVAIDSEDLLNIHAGWVSDEATTQEHYTGMRPLEQLLLLTWVC